MNIYTADTSIGNPLVNKKLQKLYIAIQASPTGVLILDPQGDIEYSNPKFLEMSGYTYDELIGKNLRILKSGIHPQEYYDSLWEVIAKGEIWHGEFYNRRKDGSCYWEENHIAPVYEDGKLVSYISFKIDISKKKEDEEKIAKYLSDLQYLNHTKDRFFSIIAHDLRNPFNALLGFSNAILTDYESKSSEEVKEMVGFIANAANSAFELLENLLIWARIQTNHIDFSPEYLNITEIVEKNIELYHISAENKLIQLINDLPPKLYTFVDRNMISTVFRNLINNAVKFTANEGIVKIYSNETPDFIEITVEDNGIGMSEKSISKLFKIHEKIIDETSHLEKGTGLGLILCKEFMEKNSGTIRVESELGKGSKFTCSLPKNFKS